MYNITCRQYSLPGAYRRMVIKPTDVKWKVYMYDDVTKELTLSDLDMIHKKEEPQSEAGMFTRMIM